MFPIDISNISTLVSQFTLLASMKKGNKPDFHHAAPPQKGRELYDIFIGQVRKLYQEDRVKDGVFQAMMDVGIVNDGPVLPPPPSPSLSSTSSTSVPPSTTPPPDAHPDPPTSIHATPCIGVDFTCLDEAVHGCHHHIKVRNTYFARRSQLKSKRILQR
jgi:D-tyrosyl-tRNA(Tyr) deacylase